MLKWKKLLLDVDQIKIITFWQTNGTFFKIAPLIIIKSKSFNFHGVSGIMA